MQNVEGGEAGSEQFGMMAALVILLIVFGSVLAGVQTPLSSSAWEVGPLWGDFVSVFVNKARGLAAAQESYRARRLLYQNGRATTVELLDAETDLTRARLDALGARIDERVASVRLAYALGQAPDR